MRTQFPLVRDKPPKLASKQSDSSQIFASICFNILENNYKFAKFPEIMILDGDLINQFFPGDPEE